MAEDADQSQKTEEPTQRKLEDARKRGQVASSREVNHWFMIAGGAVWLIVFGPGMVHGLEAALLKFIEAPHALDADAESLRVLMIETLRQVGIALLLPVLLMMAAALGAGLVQGGLVVAPDRIAPKLERISAIAGAKRLFSLRALAEFAKGLAKLAIVGVVVTLLIFPKLRGLDSFIGLDMAHVMAVSAALARNVFLGVLAVVTVVAVLDFLYQRFEFRKSMRMSRQELREEFKQTEGDPMIKSRLRQIRMERARRRMMAAVPKADVVITNPSHYAVALKYDPAEMAAPTVVAKGVDHLALRIRAIAEENAVVVVENPPLARALYAGVEVDEEIPVEYYKAVAEIIGYVFRLKKKAIPA